MATSAKVTIAEQDRSTVVSTLSGTYGGIVIASDKGPVNKPILVSSESKLVEKFGKPNPKLGTSYYSAMNYLTQSDKLWVVRASHNDAKYSGALVRARTKLQKVNGPDLEKLYNPNGFSTDYMAVCPIDGGLTQEQVDAYQFPVYATNKLYSECNATIVDGAIGSSKIRVSSLAQLGIGTKLSVSDVTLEELNDENTDVGETTATRTVISNEATVLYYNNCLVDTPVTVNKGSSVYKYDKDTQEISDFPVTPKVVMASTNSSYILVDNADYIHPGDYIFVEDQIIKFESKTTYAEDAYYITLDGKVTAIEGMSKLYLLEQAEFEDRDCFLVYSYNQGDWGNKVNIEIADSEDYENAFLIKVYDSGVLAETWEVTMDYELDGFQRQLMLEQKINDNSAYIYVKRNEGCVDENGVYYKPSLSNRAYIQRYAEEVFIPSGGVLAENVLINHREIYVYAPSDIQDQFKLGKRIKFTLGSCSKSDLNLSKEYKIVSQPTILDANHISFNVDRNIEEEEILTSLQSGWGYEPYGSVTSSENDCIVYGYGSPTDDDVDYDAGLIFIFDNTYQGIDANDNPKYDTDGVVNGVQYFPIKKVEKHLLYTYNVGSTYTISGVSYEVLDCGSNLLSGGTGGSTCTLADYIMALKKLSNKEETEVTLLLDGGITYPAYAQALSAVVEAQGTCHGFLSDSYDAEQKVEFVQGIVDYKDSLMMNTAHCSLFVGWVKIFDAYNNIYVWTSPESFGACAQSYTTRNYTFFTPAAGLTRGSINGLDITHKFTTAEMDEIVKNNMNPIRYKRGSGLYIWGNETLYAKAGPLQLRSVAMLLIMIKSSLERSLETFTFEYNNKTTWSRVESAIDIFMRDIQAKNGVYEYVVSVSGVITQLDIDNRRMPVLLAIKPTLDIQLINVTLAVYSASNTIDVSLT